MARLMKIWLKNSYGEKLNLDGRGNKREVLKAHSLLTLLLVKFYWKLLKWWVKVKLQIWCLFKSDLIAFLKNKNTLTFRSLMSLFWASSFARYCLRLRIAWYCFAFTNIGSSLISSGKGTLAVVIPTSWEGWIWPFFDTMFQNIVRNINMQFNGSLKALCNFFRSF